MKSIRRGYEGKSSITFMGCSEIFLGKHSTRWTHGRASPRKKTQRGSPLAKNSLKLLSMATLAVQRWNPLSNRPSPRSFP